MWGSRLRLGSLWVSQFCRVLADWSVRLIAVLYVAGMGRRDVAGAWYLATAVFIAPFILLAPLNGILNNGLPRRWVLSGAAFYALAVLAFFAWYQGGWLICLGSIALGAAVYSPSRYAVLPAASVDTKIRLPRINGFMEMGSASAIVLGVYLGWKLCGPDWPGGGLALPQRAVFTLLGLNLLSFLTALPVTFPSDTPRPEPVGQAIRGFFADVGRVRRDRSALGFVLGLASFQAVITAGSGALLAFALTSGSDIDSKLLSALLLVGAGAATGCLAASLQSNPRRSPGLVPYGAMALPLVLVWAMFAANSGTLPKIPCVLLGFLGGFINVPLRAAYEAAVPADARGNAMAVMNFAIYVITSLLALLMFGMTKLGWLPTASAQLGLLAVLACVGTVLSWRVLFIPALEQITEMLISPMYRVRTHGPGKDSIPMKGPLLIVANHSAYADPFWITKMVPREVTPMMTSLFFDLPVVHWLMVNVVKAIRVQEAVFRREAPELDEAVRRLREEDACILLFPEARLRRTEEVLLRPFGQGVWRILREVPETQVITCWIEGGWGSFFSYFNGLPFKNKRLDFLRRIDIAVSEPRTLPAEVLADREATRLYLQEAVLQGRATLGLPIPEPEEVEESAEPQRSAPTLSASSPRNDTQN